MSRGTYTARVEGPGWPCMVPGCSRSGHQKPVCPEHLTALPYPARLAAEVRKGAVDTIPVDCSSCGESFDMHKDVKKKPVCPDCRLKRDMERDRKRHADRRAS